MRNPDTRITIDIRDYVTRIGNGARALRKVRTKFNVPSVLRFKRAQQTETGSFHKLMVVI